jgi:hypothetical protein
MLFLAYTVYVEDEPVIPFTKIDHQPPSKNGKYILALAALALW